MWLVISNVSVIEFPQFDSAMNYAEKAAIDLITVIDTRKRVISIIEPDAFELPESA